MCHVLQTANNRPSRTCMIYMVPKNVHHGAKNVRHGAKNVRHGAKMCVMMPKMCPNPPILQSPNPLIPQSPNPLIPQSPNPPIPYSMEYYKSLGAGQDRRQTDRQNADRQTNQYYESTRP